MTPTDPHGAGPHGHGHGHEHLENAEVAHEHSDVNVRAILAFAGATAVIALIAAAAMWGLFILLENQAEAADPERSPVARPSTPLPLRSSEQPRFAVGPEPRLLLRESEVLLQLRQAEERRLEGYAWVDESAGVAQVPIEQAKRLIAERGLPVRSGGAVPPSFGTHAPAFGEANSGRTIPAPTSGAAAPAARPAGAEPAPGATTAPEGTGAVHEGQATAPAQPGAKKEGSGS